MSIRVALNHTSVYEYDRWVKLSPHSIRLRPAPHCRTPILSYSLNVEPEAHFMNWQQDPFANYVARVVFPEPVRTLKVEVELIADLTIINPFDFFIDERAEHSPFEYDSSLRAQLAPYMKVDPAGPRLKKYLAKITPKKSKTIDYLVALNQALQHSIQYTLRFEPGVQSCEETLEKTSGSCRDSSWLLIQICRQLGFAARFVSGYLVQLVPDVAALDGPSGPSADFTDLHAWCEVYIPGAGWIGLDPTSGLFAGEGHIPLACTPFPQTAAAISGMTDKCEVTFDHKNEVSRFYESPRVTKPYTEQEWDQIHQLGTKVDSDLERMDVRLTMGGEPTFVSLDDMESPEWNTDALGDEKLKLAKELLLRLKHEYAPKGVLHYGQGKWYPGEPLPRWALSCYWRTDGEALWQDAKLLAAMSDDLGHTLEQAQQFIVALSKKLDLPEDYIQPAFEDPIHHLLSEQKLPHNIDPRKASLEDDLERRRLAHLLMRGLNQPTGYVLPLNKMGPTGDWMSSAWPLRLPWLVLIPGDSAIGLRLPLDSLPRCEDPLEEILPGPDPFEARSPLGSKAETAIKPKKSTKPKNPPLVRTAFSTQIRQGKLHLFLPPLNYLEDYIELLKVIEQIAQELHLPVVLEGYGPPSDPRLQKLMITPDPGVIEVNIHPASNWQELTHNLNRLYELARESRLITEKFMLDGRHTGTGGGNHVTLGGATPADSPFLRRPHLLRSLITYWQNHPALSYFFSGLFIGPTSQAPRVDEARDELLYELEIAFQQFPPGDVDQPWLIDRLLRNLLVDVTGNTHRAEFCIDKLYSPDSTSGRQGILEFRGFEMPPHAQMAAVQALLIRTLVARFWAHPYQQKLVHWGSQLHDKFMLPHYLWQDMRQIVTELNQQGYQFQLSWLAPFAEFRFPTYGTVQLDDVQIEVRAAIEPWHVLGEETTSMGTARYVDSSVERLQVKVSGIATERYVLLCNGRRVPLRSTGRGTEYVAGIRYRAWQPPSALHPNLKVNTPLVIDIVDSWSQRSIGGCTYHVMHPGGRNYETAPINAYEAEGRRLSRFSQLSHSPGIIEPPPVPGGRRLLTPHDQQPRPMDIAEIEAAPESVHTLDLRRRYTH